MTVSDEMYGSFDDIMPIERPTIYVPPLAPRSDRVMRPNDFTAARLNMPVSVSIKWDEEKASLCAKKVSLSLTIDPIQRIWPEAYPHFSLFVERLDYHRSTFNPKLLPTMWFVEQSLISGPAFNDSYADAWKAARFEFMHMKYVVEPDKPQFILEGNSFDELFHPGFLLFWEPDDPDDYTYMFGDKPECREDTLREVENLAAEYSERLLTDVEIMTDAPDEVIYKPVGSSGFDGLENTAPEWSLEWDNPGDDYEETALISKRSTAPKGPHEIRDIGILKPQSLRAHRRVMWPLQQACRRIKGCVYGRPNSFIRNAVQIIGCFGRHYYMRDYTKSGMTIPHEVISAIFRGFYRRRPEYATKGINLFINQLYFYEDSSGEMVCKRPTTGAPLGLFVEGYTLLQYIIHDINVARGGTHRKSLFSATNDDMIVAFKSSTEAETYQEIDQVTNADLGMYYKDTKSGITKNKFVFCEHYLSIENNKLQVMSKKSLHCLALFGAKYACNVLQAKEYVYSVYLSSGGNNDLLDSVFSAVCSHWADQWEFDSDEFNWPFLFGGWRPCIKDGLDHSVEWYNEYLDFRSACAYWSARISIRRKGSLREKPGLAIGRLYGLRLLEDPKDEEEWVDFVPLFGTKRTLQRHYRKTAYNPQDSAQEYNSLLKIRKEDYKRRIQSKVELIDPMIGWLSRHPKSVIHSWLPGLKLANPITRVEWPTNGIEKTPLWHWLSYLSYKGVIAMDKPSRERVSPTMCRLFEAGIRKKLNWSYIPIPGEAFSCKLLNGELAGYLEFYEREQKCIISMDEDDEVLPCTAIWHLLPSNNVYEVQRWWDLYKNQSLSHGIALELLPDVFRADKARRREVVEEHIDPEPDEDDPGDTNFSLTIADYLAGLWKDLHPGEDYNIAELRERIIPRFSKLQRDDETMSDHSVDVFDDPYGAANWEVKQDEEDVIDDDGFFDPWATLEGY
jgi:hypothetical protein